MPKNKPFDILFLGHSLIEFFDWQNRFPLHRVVNLGVAGETVEGLLSRIPRIVKKFPSADLIFIMTGTNNIAMEDYDIFYSYGQIVDRLSAAYKDARIFIHNILPFELEWVTKESIVSINLSLKKFAQEKNAEFIDLYPLFVKNNHEIIHDFFLDDGVHLSEEGYRVWSDEVEKIIKRE